MGQESATVVLPKLLVQDVKGKLPLPKFRLFLRLILLGYVKINQLRGCYIPIDVDHYILRFDVAMGNFLTVEVIHSVSHLVIDLHDYIVR